MDKSRTPEISAETGRYPWPHPRPPLHLVPHLTQRFALPVLRFQNAADKAVNAGKVVKVHKCPICGKLTDNAKYRPFCSKRCADIDLGTWFAEGYVIEGKAPVDEEEGE